MPLPQLPLDFVADAAELPVVELAQCPHCDCDIAPGHAVEHAGEPHCSDCVHTCENCGLTTTDIIDLVESYNSGAGHRRQSYGTALLCEECRWECADCGESFADGIDQFRNASEENICESCEESYTHCESCDRVIHTDNSYYDEAGERTLCHDCYREVEAEEEGRRDDDGEVVIHQHWHKPKPVFFDLGKVPSNHPTAPVYFGVEFEVDSPRQLDNVDNVIDVGLHPNEFYHCEEDGSLTHGFEVVSKAATWAYWQSADLSWMSALANKGYRSFQTTTCGQHVHVSRSFLTNEHVFCLLAFFKRNTPLMKKLSRRATDTGYCKFFPIANASTRTLSAKCRGSAGNHDRYEAINLDNQHTVEFRLFRGTLSIPSFRRNLSLVVALVHYVKWANGGRSNWFSGDMFAKWVRTKGREVLGAADAKILSTWIESALAEVSPTVDAVA